MKTLALAISFFTLATGVASAADMAVKVAPPAPLPSWTGFYIGGHGGYGWKDDPFSFTVVANPLVVLDGFKSSGWVGGGHFGYNWQYGAMVAGLELDVSATGISGSSAVSAVTPGFTVAQSIGHDVKLLGSARGRIGWAPNSDWMLYGTGGVAWEREDQTSFFSNAQPGFSISGTTSNPVTLLGWIAGAGVEARLTGTNWIARLEYLHYDFGHSRAAQSFTNVNQGIPTVSVNTVGSQTIDVVRAGLSYKFGL